MDQSFLQKNAAFIWRSNHREKPDQYLVFRKKFTLDAENAEKVRLDIQ